MGMLKCGNHSDISENVCFQFVDLVIIYNKMFVKLHDLFHTIWETQSTALWNKGKTIFLSIKYLILSKFGPKWWMV